MTPGPARVVPPHDWGHTMVEDDRVYSGGLNVRTVVKFARNSKCPCGSGLKFKRCHNGKLKTVFG